MAKLFNVTPKPAGLRSVQNENWNMAGALSESSPCPAVMCGRFCRERPWEDESHRHAW